jgi:ATP-dependent DNA ligase
VARRAKRFENEPTLSQCQEFVIGGYTPGNPFDALIVGCYAGDKLNFVAKVRNGFVPYARREVFQRLRGSETDKCPFGRRSAARGGP